MHVTLDMNSVSDYHLFLKIKSLPRYRFVGRTAYFPDEYAKLLDMRAEIKTNIQYIPKNGLFDYQEAIIKIAIAKKKFAIFADCGLGKTLMMLEFARYCRDALPKGKAILIISPLMVVDQTMGEAEKFYGNDLQIDQVKANRLTEWMNSGESRIGITNYDALCDETPQGRLGALILDESSMLKSSYGKWGQKCIDLGKGLEYKLACTGTPAPNDRVEYGNHAIFMDRFPTLNSFMAKYFVNKGETGERWELKPHALYPFYRSLSDWCIFLTNPATYGWKDNTDSIPPINVHIHNVDMTKEQTDLAFSKTGELFANNIGGITSRSVLSQIAKGSYKGEKIDTQKPEYIRNLVESWPEESTIIWCKYNSEQEIAAATFPDAANIDGQTPYEERKRLIHEFKTGTKKVLISKSKIVGFGLNLQIATRHVFSCLQDSYEEYYQCIKRSNRYGSKRPLNVHIPITDIERPMVETVLSKAKRVQEDTETQERIFKNAAIV